MFEVKQKYVDYNDVEREETFYFHINKTELRKLEMSENGGLSALIGKVTEAKDQKTLMELFYRIIDLSYGEKDLDGRGFHKSKDILERFKASAAYSDFCERLLADEKFAAQFVNGIMPKDLMNEVQKIDKSNLGELEKKALEKITSV